MSDSEFAEMQRIYERIESMWVNGWSERQGFFTICFPPPGFELRVLETDGWQRGWALIKQWVNNKVARPWVGEPHWRALWANEIHIWSHTVHSSLTNVQGHTLTSAKLEEDLTKLVLHWLGPVILKKRTEINVRLAGNWSPERAGREMNAYRTER